MLGKTNKIYYLSISESILGNRGGGHAAAEVLCDILHVMPSHCECPGACITNPYHDKIRRKCIENFRIMTGFIPGELSDAGSTDVIRFICEYQQMQSLDTCCVDSTFHPPRCEKSGLNTEQLKSWKSTQSAAGLDEDTPPARTESLHHHP